MGEITFKECEFIIKISLIKSKENLPISEVARRIGTRSSSPTFNSVIKKLIEKNAIELHNYFGAMKLVKIKEKEITDLIDDFPLTNLFHNYFKEFHVVSW